MKKLTLLFSFLLIALAGQAQSVNVHKTNGEVLSIPMTEINYIDFSEKDETVSPPEGVEAVDLGLPSGTKWANMNVGATKPEEPGGYYAYGEIEEKELYIADTYNEPVKTGEEYQHGYWPLESILFTQYDVAYMKWGGTWHMPTYEQARELSQNCTFTWSKLNGVSGCLITSNKNGNNIFIPLSGYRLRNSTKYSETIAGFWAEQPGMGSATAHAYPINITESACFIRTPSDESKNKYIGWPVRPVSD